MLFYLCATLGVSWGLFNAIVCGYLYTASLYLSQYVTATVQPKYSRYLNPVYAENPFNLPRMHNVNLPLQNKFNTKWRMRKGSMEGLQQKRS